MFSMRIIKTALLAASLAASLHAAEPIDPDVLAVREAAWRAWFSGDEAALRSMLPQDFLSISMSSSEIVGFEKTLTSSRTFKENGGKLVALSFPETRAQR